ncbi:RNA recognition motif containing protein [Colletotrichum karsti]|uniref:RNA recognition motif containing protein n=1 Tax=Colletotrichum karsti TaxID=1095194 RepID=A0A9P6LEQ5_9PEZI|nr:RNA recognition motif containing protein [Colletotrichum karsti]KAF9873419.1 RNA recognition motif containing protein [Colletotrichum karsti]
MVSLEQPAALVEGRRIYLGNLLYIVRPVEIEETLKGNDFGGFEKIHISVDPVSSRNPGYCFVDFIKRADAERALSSLNVEIRGRPVKVGPCEPKKPRERGWRSEPAPADQRWGNWTGQKEVGTRKGECAPYGQMSHFDEAFSTDGDGRRIRIGGLTKMIDQQYNQDEIRGLLAGFNPKAIGKRITAHESTRSVPGHHNYCFVDFETAEEAAAVIEALHGTPYEEGKLTVGAARPIPRSLQESSRWVNDQVPEKRDNARWRERPARQDDWSRESRPNPSRPQNSTRNEVEGGWPSASRTSTSDQRPSWTNVKSDQSPQSEHSTWRKFGSGASSSPSSKPDQPSKSLTSNNWRQRGPA